MSRAKDQYYAAKTAATAHNRNCEELQEMLNKEMQLRSNALAQEERWALAYAAELLAPFAKTFVSFSITRHEQPAFAIIDMRRHTLVSDVYRQRTPNGTEGLTIHFDYGDSVVVEDDEWGYDELIELVEAYVQNRELP